MLGHPAPLPNPVLGVGQFIRTLVGHFLASAGVVHKAYLRFIGQAGTDYRDRAHFFQIAAHLMRQILVDRARKRRSNKRGGEGRQISLDRALEFAEAQPADLLVLDDALSRLQQLDARQCQIGDAIFRRDDRGGDR